MEALTKAIVSAIIERFNQDGQIEILLQERWKPLVSPQYAGMLELPAGGIDPYEGVTNALRREIKEETSLILVEIIGAEEGDIINPREGDKARIFRPWLCQEVLETRDGLPWVGFVFRCRVEGELKLNSDEARNPIWVTVNKLKDMLLENQAQFFPLQLPVLQEWIKFHSP